MNQSPMLRFMATLGDRLAVGRRALDPLAGVRILLPQPNFQARHSKGGLGNLPQGSVSDRGGLGLIHFIGAWHR